MTLKQLIETLQALKVPETTKVNVQFVNNDGYINEDFELERVSYDPRFGVVLTATEL